jgi:uncharacterized C2H2 Zn-finger protein
MSYVCEFDGCEYSNDTKKKFKQHQMHSHNVGVTLKKCSECSQAFKTTQTLNVHLWKDHKIESGSRHACTESGCSKVYFTKAGLDQHILSKHTPDLIKWIYCQRDGCTQRRQTNTSLNKHLREFHDENTILYECDQPNCSSTPFKNQGNLTRHLRETHKIGGTKMHKCNKCDLEFYSNSKLKRHNHSAHNDGSGKYYPCTVDNCQSSPFKNGSNLKAHLWQSHRIGEGEELECPECKMVFLATSILKAHRWKSHNVGTGTLHECTHCAYSCKSSTYIKIHLSNSHDIGDKECAYCVQNVFTLNKYLDPITNTTSNICKKCYNKVTGYTTRKEHVMVDALKENKDIGPYIVLTDKIIKHNECNTLRRPDVLISSPGKLHIIVECDEAQHKGYINKCESGRMDEIIDEFKEGRVIFIRWNPDTYKPPDGEKRVARKDRLIELQKLIISLSIKDWTDDDAYVSVYYMYYDNDNPVVAERFEKHLLY